MSKTIPLQSGIDETNHHKLNLIANNKGIAISMLIRFILLDYIENKKDFIKELIEQDLNR